MQNLARLSLLSTVWDAIGTNQILAVMPISRFVIEAPFRIGRFYFFPAGTGRLAQLRPVPNYTADAELIRTGQVFLEGQQLREFQTSATGASVRNLNASSLVAFPTDLDWDVFLSADHEFDIKLIRRLGQMAERAMDLVRLHFCRFDLPETLPGPVGMWNDSPGFSAALLYTPHDHESYLIAGSVMLSVVAKGLGLELDNGQASIVDGCEPPTIASGEVGGIVQHALSLFSDVMYANTATTKYTRAMTLLEFLASPFSYAKFKDAKKAVAVHVAQTSAQYGSLLSRFEELSSKFGKDGQQVGLRTLLVHHGEFLEGLLDDGALKLLFRELQRYCHCVIEDMLERVGMSWEGFEELRVLRRKQILAA